jgi:hypothetical protein
MPSKKRRGTRTETLSLRLDPKTKFTLEFVARINGQTLTTVIERAIRKSCDEVTIGDNSGSDRLSWNFFWDPDAGVRALKLLACREYPSTYDEDQLRHFTKVHWPFFYTHLTSDNPCRMYVEILWPKIEEYLRIWRDQRDFNYWAAGAAMAADLSAAQLKAPAWPRGSATDAAMAADSFAAQPQPPDDGKKPEDDEIPF